jgi:hypothetical protein
MDERRFGDLVLLLLFDFLMISRIGAVSREESLNRWLLPGLYTAAADEAG